MKEIQPIQIWVNGNLQKAIWFLLSINSDNLTDSATFYYSLKDANTNNIAVGNLTINGEAYKLWDSNEYAFNWAANELNIVLV